MRKNRSHAIAEDALRQHDSGFGRPNWPTVEKFQRYEDGSVTFPNGKVLDAEAKKVRNPIKPKRSK